MNNILNNLADRDKRLFAYLIDIVPIILFVTAVFYIFLGFDETLDSYLNRGNDLEPRIDYLKQRNWISQISFLIWIIYSIIAEASPRQGTFGKSVMGIKVIDEFGNPMTLNKSLGRNTSKTLSLFVFSLGFIWILFDKQHQGWHDKINRTFVVFNNFKNESDSINT